MIDLDGTLSWERVSHLVQQAKTTTSSWIDYFEDDEQQLLQQILSRLNHHEEATQKYVSLKSSGALSIPLLQSQRKALESPTSLSLYVTRRSKAMKNS